MIKSKFCVGFLALALVAAIGLMAAGTPALADPAMQVGLHSIAPVTAAIFGVGHLGSMHFGPRVCFEASGGGSGGGTKTAAELAGEIKAAHEKAISEVKAIAEDALGKARAGETLTSSMKERADEALIKMNGLAEQVAGLEQKFSRSAYGGQGDAEKSIGEQFVESEGVKEFAASGRSSGKADVRFKADITSATTNAPGSAGAGVAPTRLPGIIQLPQRRLTVVDLLTPGRMEGNALEYVQETGFTNAAAIVAEGATKPQSDIQFALKSTTAKVIANYMKASRQILDDFGQLRSVIDQRLLYNLDFAKEAQVLNGDGTGQNLHGILAQATEFSVPAGTVQPNPTTAIDTLRLAMLQAALAEYSATGHVLHPIDWTGIELTKDGEGRYILANPQGTAQPTMWGLPVVSTQSMAVGTFLTGAFQLGAQFFDRWDARVEVGYVDKDFINNMVTILAEMRGALAVYRPEAFITGSIIPAS